MRWKVPDTKFSDVVVDGIRWHLWPTLRSSSKFREDLLCWTLDVRCSHSSWTKHHSETVWCQNLNLSFDGTFKFSQFIAYVPPYLCWRRVYRHNACQFSNAEFSSKQLIFLLSLCQNCTTFRFPFNFFCKSSNSDDLRSDTQKSPPPASNVISGRALSGSSIPDTENQYPKNQIFLFPVRNEKSPLSSETETDS